tara:strand:- start:482 stop:667 length:186 start_codon:yes stop_codon:yes gene_type:complete
MGLIQIIFNFLLKRKLMNNQEFLDSVDKLDKSREELQKSILDAEKKKVIIPDELKKYSGLK